MQEIVKVQDLSVNFIGEHGNIQALENINFSVQEGEFLTVLGPSGCGKSTLLKSLFGLLPVTAGHIYIDGEELTGSDEETLARLLVKMGVLFQSGACNTS